MSIYTTFHETAIFCDIFYKDLTTYRTNLVKYRNGVTQGRGRNEYSFIDSFIEASVGQRWPWMIHPNVFVFNFINFLLGCSSVVYGWKDQCRNGSLCCRHHIYVWFRVWWSCCMLVCLLLQLSVCLPLSWGVVLEQSSTLCNQLQDPPRT